MSKMHDTMAFYAQSWDINEDGVKVPSIELLHDRGERARAMIHPAAEKVQPENIVQSVMKISCVEIAEALRDLLLASNMQVGEARNMKIGSACVALQNAEHRIRSVTRA